MADDIWVAGGARLVYQTPASRVSPRAFFNDAASFHDVQLITNHGPTMASGDDRDSDSNRKRGDAGGVDNELSTSGADVVTCKPALSSSSQNHWHRTPTVLTIAIVVHSQHRA